MSAGAFVGGMIAVGTLATIAFVSSPDPTVPIDELTPGIVASTDVSEVCGRIEGVTYSERHRKERHDKYRIMLAYGYDISRSRDYELNHRVPLALGGADIVANLWPEPWGGQMNAHDKDHLEDWAWRSVCLARTLSLRDAQEMFFGDWREPFDRYCQIAHLCNGSNGT
jgi:hypothetical protein